MPKARNLISIYVGKIEQNLYFMFVSYVCIYFFFMFACLCLYSMLVIVFHVGNCILCFHRPFIVHFIVASLPGD